MQAWSVALPGAVSYPLIVDGTVVVARTAGPQTFGSTVAAYNQATGAVIWDHGLGGVDQFTGVAYEAGLVFAVTFGGALTAFDLASGETVWHVQLPTYWVSSPPTARDGVLYVPMEAGQKIGAVREHDGQLLWTADVSPTGAVAVDGHAVYAAGDCSGGYALDPHDGHELWHQSDFCGDPGGRVVVLGDGVVWGRGTFGGGVARSAATGGTLGPFSSQTAPAVGAGKVLTMTNGALHAAPSTATAPESWTFAGDGALSTAPLVVDGHVIVGSAQGVLHAVDPATGTAVWSADAGGPLDGFNEQTTGFPPGMAAANGTLVVGAGHSLEAWRTAGSITAAPQNVAAPSVDGAMQAGQRLAADVGRWSGLPNAYIYQWRRCDDQGGACADVVGADELSYIPPDGDAGRTFRVRVAAVNGLGSAAAVESAATPPLQVALPTPQSAPTIAGEAREGATLTASPGVWSGNPTSFTYRWEQCDSPWGGTSCTPVTEPSSSATHKLTSADIGYKLVVEVRAANAGGRSGPSASARSGVVLPLPPVSQSDPAVVGVPQVGETLSANRGAWGGEVDEFVYQWFRCDATGTFCPDIAGADSPEYELTDDDVDSYVGVEIVGRNAGGESDPVDSPAIGPVLPLPPQLVTAPVISGTPQAGSTLTTSNGEWASEPPSKFTYNWFSCKGKAVSCSAIASARAATFTARTIDVGRWLAVVVAATNRGGTTLAPSDTVGPVAAAPVTTPIGPVTIAPTPTPTGPVTGSGTAPITTPPPPVNTFKTLRHVVRRDGALRLDERADGPGTFTAVATTAAAKAARSAKPRRVVYASGKVVAKAAGRVALTLRPTKQGRRALRRARRLHLTVTVSFTAAAGGAPRQAAFAVTVTQPRP